MLRTIAARINVGKCASFERIISNGCYRQQIRGMTRWREKQLRELYQRGRSFDATPHKVRPRSDWQDWNYSAELYAFANRLGESGLSENSLVKMFTHRSYLEQMERKQQALGIEEVSIGADHNEQLIEHGEALARPFIESYLRYYLRQAPEECIQAVTNHLLSVEVLSETAKWIGCIDLVQTAEFPPSLKTLADTTLALLGTMQAEVGIKQTHNFIIDFLLTHLHGVDILEIWKLENLELNLNEYLKLRGASSSYEPRIMFQSGQGTLEACTVVGLYLDRKLIGQSPGETASIAKAMAELDAFRRLFGLETERICFEWGPPAYQLDFTPFSNKTNFTLFNETKQKEASKLA